MEHTSKKSLDQLLGQALAERSREDDQVEVTYEMGDGTSYDKQQRLKPNVGTPSLKEDPEEDNTEPLGSVELERKVMRSTLTLGIALVLCCNGLATLQGLQSSVFPRVGVDALCTLYSFAALSCLCAPAIVCWAGPNWTCVVYAAVSLTFLASFHLYNPYALVACSVALGWTLGPVLCAFDTHLSLNVSRLSPHVTRGMRDATQQRFLKRFCVIAKTGVFWGNLTASLVTHFGVKNVELRAAGAGINATTDPEVETEMSASAIYDFCFQFQEDSGFLDFTGFTIRFKSLSVGVLMLVFGAFIIVGASLFVFFLERISFLVQQDPLERPLVLQSLRQIRLVLVDRQMRLAAPLIVFIGIEQGFIVADFTRSYVSCSLGLDSVVLTMMCVGGSNTLGSLAVHLFSEHIQRTVIMAAGLVCQSGLLMVLYLWTPDRDDAAVFYVIAAGWGLCNAIWETLTITYVASTYVDAWQVPFTTCRLLQWVGSALSLSVSNYLGSQVKVCLLAASLLIAIVPYTVLEFRIHHRNIVHNRTAIL